MEDKLVSGLSRRSSVRGFAEKTARGETPYDIAPLLAALHSESYVPWREQIVAAQLLGELPLNPLEKQRAAEVLSVIVADSRSRPNPHGRNRRWLERSFLLSIMATAGIGAAYLPSEPNMNGSDIVVCLLFCLLCFAPIVWPFSEVTEDIRFCRLRAAAIRTLGRLRIPQLVGLPARALLDAGGIRKRIGSRQVRQAVTETLPDMLAMLTTDHYGRLDGQVVPDLCRALELADEKLILALLGALEKAGDGRAVKSVEELANDSFTRMLRASPAVRAEAGRILPTLLARREQENAAKMLLRASGPAAASPNVLLRPAVNNETVDHQALLRSGIAPGEASGPHTGTY